jgi:hypothetical protein
MTKIAQASFIATTKTTVVFGRELTDAEKTALGNSKKSALGAGHQVSIDAIDTATQTFVALWSDAADAEAYVAVAGGFTPAPTSVTVEAAN